MAHRSLSSLVFAGFDPTTAATVISMMGDEGLPDDIRVVRGLAMEPWQHTRSGLLVIGMDPTTDLVRVSQLIQNRTTYWEVAVAIPEVLSYYSVALLAQGAAKVISHPENDLEASKMELRSVLRTLANLQSDAFGLEVADLIQLYGEKRMAKTLRLTGGGCVGSIFLNNGSVVHSETMDSEIGMEAFRRLISLVSPEIRVHKGCLTDQKTIGIPAMSALLEGSRQVDEILRASNVVEKGTSDVFDSFDIDPSDMPSIDSSMDGLPKLNDFGPGNQSPQEVPDSFDFHFGEPEEPKPRQFDPLKNLFGEDVD